VSLLDRICLLFARKRIPRRGIVLQKGKLRFLSKGGMRNGKVYWITGRYRMILKRGPKWGKKKGLSQNKEEWREVFVILKKSIAKRTRRRG